MQFDFSAVDLHKAVTAAYGVAALDVSSQGVLPRNCIRFFEGGGTLHLEANDYYHSLSIDTRISCPPFDAFNATATSIKDALKDSPNGKAKLTLEIPEMASGVRDSINYPYTQPRLKWGMSITRPFDVFADCAWWKPQHEILAGVTRLDTSALWVDHRPLYREIPTKYAGKTLVEIVLGDVGEVHYNNPLAFKGEKLPRKFYVEQVRNLLRYESTHVTLTLLRHTVNGEYAYAVETKTANTTGLAMALRF